jgi:hypothetical protein
MPSKVATIDAEDAAQRYLAGESLKGLAARYRVRSERVRRVLIAANVPIRGSGPLPLPDDEIIRRYVEGESEKMLAERFGVSRAVIRRRLLKRGIDPRGRSESMRVRMANTPPEERRRLAAAAHDAVRGRIRSWDERVQAAQTRELRQTHVGPAELLMQRWLADRGITSVPQQAVGIYNVDLGLHPVAVEIFGGNWHGHGGHRSSAGKRFRYILDQGWCVVIIWVDRREYPLHPLAADYVITRLEHARRDPSLRGKYWVIRGDGQEIAAAEVNVEHIALVPSGR